MTKRSIEQDASRRRADLQRLIRAGRHSGMTDDAMMRAGIRRADLLESKPVKPDRSTPGAPTINDIAAEFVWQATVNGLDLKLEDLTAGDTITGARRNVNAGPRAVAIWLARTVLAAPFAEIGAYFGGRDHSTVMHAFKVSGPKQIALHPVLAKVSDAVREKFQGNLLK